VLQLVADGFSEKEIAAQLQILQPTISKDLSLLRKQAKENIHKYIDKPVPFEYNVFFK
jgi:DNA-binding NarL/FixJ family response regulator